MDLKHRASFPNKEPHMLTTTENAKLNRQVEEFLEKGSIRESLIPYAILILLAPKKNGECALILEILIKSH